MKKRELKQEISDCTGLNTKLADILRRTAVAVRGDPPGLVGWGWYDLPERLACRPLTQLRTGLPV